MPSHDFLSMSIWPLSFIFHCKLCVLCTIHATHVTPCWHPFWESVANDIHNTYLATLQKPHHQCAYNNSIPVSISSTWDAEGSWHDTHSFSTIEIRHTCFIIITKIRKLIVTETQTKTMIWICKKIAKKLMEKVL